MLQTAEAKLVMTVDAENKVAPRPVQTAEWRGKDWVITGGLQPGDKVIVDNLIKLRPQMPVAPHAPGVPPAGAPGAKQPDAGKPAPATPDAKPAGDKPEQPAATQGKA